MPKYDHRKCEDDEDATRMAEIILRCLGYTDVSRGRSLYEGKIGYLDRLLLQNIARNAERIAKWARNELKSKAK